MFLGKYVVTRVNLNINASASSGFFKPIQFEAKLSLILNPGLATFEKVQVQGSLHPLVPFQVQNMTKLS